LSSPLFSSFKLRTEILRNLSSLGYQYATPVQEQSLPLILDGKDVISQAKTGSGKTAAFGLGLLQKLNVQQFRIQSLVLCPTRELADQVAKEIRKLARAIHNIKILTLCGGMPLGPQIGSLEHGAHIIVGTPGRIEEHLRKGTLSLTNVTTLVLDEADRMLDMGFQASLDSIIKQTPAIRQTLLFSATYPDKIQSIAKKIMIQPIIVKVASVHDNTSISQFFLNIDKNRNRVEVLHHLLLQHRPESTIIFCNTKKETQDIADKLKNYGFSVLALHGDLEQKIRDQTLVRFSNKSASILIATDVAARGLDIESVELVINLHIARDLEVHTHRIGRTGRAGRKGIALTFYSDNEQYKLDRLQEYLNHPIEKIEFSPTRLKDESTYQPPMDTLQLDSGKKQKIRPGDILGALTGHNGIAGNQVGKIDIFDQCAYVAIQHHQAVTALKILEMGKLKGRSVRVRMIRR